MSKNNLYFTYDEIDNEYPHVMWSSIEFGYKHNGFICHSFRSTYENHRNFLKELRRERNIHVRLLFKITESSEGNVYGFFGLRFKHKKDALYFKMLIPDDINQEE